MKLSDARHQDRQFAGLALAGFLAMLMLSGLISLLSGGGDDVRTSNALVFSNLKQTPQRIAITTSRYNYTLAKQDTGWVLVERGNFPIDPQKMTAMLDAITQARFTEARTASPARHDDLGLGEPLAGRTGALISFPDLNASGIILGVKGGQTYARRFGDNQTWLVSMEFPALHSPIWWLNLEDIGLPRLKPVEEVRVRDIAAGTIETIRNDNPQLSTADEILLNAAALTQPVDVIALPAEGLSPFAEHSVFYSDGTGLTFRLYNFRGGIWAEIFGNALARPDLTNGRLFRLDPLSASDLLPY